MSNVISFNRVSPWHCCSFINFIRHIQCCFSFATTTTTILCVGMYLFPNNFVWFKSVWYSITLQCSSLSLSLAISLSLSLSSYPHLHSPSLSSLFRLSFSLTHSNRFSVVCECVCVFVCLYACYASFHSISFRSKIITMCRINQQQ